MKRPSREEAAAAVEAMGFTALEASIYVELLRGGPQTGYGIAKQVGKAVANAYKALDVLDRRGVVCCEDGSTRLYRALPYAEVAAKLADDFARRSQRAVDALESLDGANPDDRIYRLNGADAIYERARAILASAQVIAVVDAFPECVDVLADELRAAARRGVKVTLHAYAPAEIAGVTIVEQPTGSTVRRRWPGSWLNLCADGAAILIAHLLDDERTVGMWTENAYISFVFYCGMTSETAIARLSQIAATQPTTKLGAGLERVADILAADVPGRAALRRQMTARKENVS
jgi:hypothetical protein